MSMTMWAVILLGGVLGYGAVSWLIDRVQRDAKSAPAPSANPPTSPPGAGEAAPGDFKSAWDEMNRK